MSALDPKSLLAQVQSFCCYQYYPAQMMLMELALLNQIVQSLTGGGGGGGSGQIVGYTGASPTADGVVPTDLNAPAIAVKPSATTYTWDPVNHVWT